MIGQIENAFRKLKPDVSNDEILSVQKRIVKKMAAITEKQSPFYGQKLYQSIAEELGMPDPYYDLKKEYNQIALNMIPKLKKRLEKMDDPLLGAILISLIGNSIDFGVSLGINLEQELADLNISCLGINNYADFRRDLERARTLLIVGDNAGEIVFDKLLLEVIHSQYPDKSLFFAVRGGPAINDATINDAKMVGLGDIAEIIASSASPGVILEQTSPEFRTLFHSVDLIISKGQGNFESLDDLNPAKAEIYFFLKTKCNLVANILKTQLGKLIIAKKSSIFT
jgi:hypothetical protein